MRQNALKKEFYQNWEYYLLLLPVLIYYALFHYLPIGNGVVMAFKDVRPGLSVFTAEWVGFQWFRDFISSPYFWRSLKNTLVLSLTTLVANFPIPIIFSIALNEVKNKRFKKITQSVSYFPYFVSMVVVVGMLYNFLSMDNGLVNNMIKQLGGEPINFMNSVQAFIPMYVLTEMWQKMGWSAVVYLAALTSIDPTLYEAAHIDGAGRLRQMWHISLPGIRSSITVMLLLNIGNMLLIGHEKILLMYNPANYDVADVVSTYIYREGILNRRFSYATAVGLFNQVISFIILMISNKCSRKMTGESLW